MLVRSHPLLIAMKGLPGSGKSSLARELERRTGWEVIDKDETKDALHGVVSDAGHHAYAITLAQVEALLCEGKSLIYDSPLTFPSLYKELCDSAARNGATLCLIECRCSDEAELRQRIEERSGTGLSAHRITDWQNFLAYRQQTAEHSNYPTTHPHYIVDTTEALARTTESALAWLRAQHPPPQHPAK